MASRKDQTLLLLIGRFTTFFLRLINHSIALRRRRARVVSVVGVESESRDYRPF